MHIPLRVQLVTACDKLCKLYFSKYFNIIFKKIYRVLQTVIGLYRVARQCCQFYVPERRSKRNKQGSSQQLIQTVPPTDEFIPGLQTRLTLVLMEPSPLLAPSTPQTPDLQQDRVTEESASETSTTHRENLQLQNRNSPEDISDVLGTNAFQGYVDTPLQTLDGIVVNEPERFLPLAEEAKCLAEEIHIEKLNKQWAGIPHEKLLNQSFRD